MKRKLKIKPDNDSYVYLTPKTNDEYKKERSWIERIGKWLVGDT